MHADIGMHAETNNYYFNFSYYTCMYVTLLKLINYIQDVQMYIMCMYMYVFVCTCFQQVLQQLQSNHLQDNKICQPFVFCSIPEEIHGLFAENIH